MDTERTKRELSRLGLQAFIDETSMNHALAYWMVFGSWVPAIASVGLAFTTGRRSTPVNSQRLRSYCLTLEYSHDRT